MFAGLLVRRCSSGTWGTFWGSVEAVFTVTTAPVNTLSNSANDFTQARRSPSKSHPNSLFLQLSSLYRLKRTSEVRGARKQVPTRPSSLNTLNHSINKACPVARAQLDQRPRFTMPQKSPTQDVHQTLENRAHSSVVPRLQLCNIHLLMYVRECARVCVDWCVRVLVCVWCACIRTCARVSAC